MFKFKRSHFRIEINDHKKFSCTIGKINERVETELIQKIKNLVDSFNRALIERGNFMSSERAFHEITIDRWDAMTEPQQNHLRDSFPVKDYMCNVHYTTGSFRLQRFRCNEYVNK